MRASSSGCAHHRPISYEKDIGATWGVVGSSVVDATSHFAEKSCMRDVRPQVNSVNLKDRERWAMGWLQRHELQAVETSGPVCRKCDGTGATACHLCAMPGQVIQL